MNIVQDLAIDDQKCRIPTEEGGPCASDTEAIQALVQRNSQLSQRYVREETMTVAAVKGCFYIEIW